MVPVARLTKQDASTMPIHRIRSRGMSPLSKGDSPLNHTNRIFRQPGQDHPAPSMEYSCRNRSSARIGRSPLSRSSAWKTVDLKRRASTGDSDKAGNASIGVAPVLSSCISGCVSSATQTMQHVFRAGRKSGRLSGIRIT